MRKLPVSLVVALVLLAGVAALVGLVPFLPGYDPFGQNLMAMLAPPFTQVGERVYWLGTDGLGRDNLSRLALAGQVSLVIGLGAVVISLITGVTLGLIAGYFRGWIENTIMGLADLQLSIPRVLLLIAVAALLGSSVLNLTLLLGLTSWVTYGRVARAMAMSLRRREYVLSAITQGATPAWNIRRHLLPNVLPQMLIVASFELGQITVLEASLSFLGLGVQPPLPSWGMMIAESQNYLEIAPHTMLLPSVAIFMFVAGLQFLSQSFTAEGQDAPDVATRRSA